MAPKRDAVQRQQHAAAEPPSSLPTTTNGTLLDRSSWLQELANCAHLFESDVAYLLHTGCGLTSVHTAVITPEHSALLNRGYIQKEKQNYGVLNPPPITNGFRTLYSQVSVDQSLATNSGDPTTAGSTAASTDLPLTAPTTLPDNHKLSPDRILLLYLKLRNVILGLISSRGRKAHYQNLTQTGCELLTQLIEEARPSKADYSQSPHILKITIPVSLAAQCDDVPH